MRILVQILAICLLLTFASAVSAQTPLTCGIVGIDGPTQVVPGTRLVLKAKITGMLHTTKPEFKWKLSAGTITTGQGTDEITIDTLELGGQEVIATVELSGAPLGCNGSASRTTQVERLGVDCCHVFDEYGDLKFEDEKARLDNFAIQLSNQPQSIGYILTSAGQKTYANEAAERLDRAKSYLVKVRNMDLNRVVTLDCGFTVDLTIKLYIAPLGASPPACSTIVGIPLSDVKFTKPRPAPAKKRH